MFTLCIAHMSMSLLAHYSLNIATFCHILQIICSYLFWPIALIIGVESSQCLEVAKLIGIKVFTTEILAYQQLGVSINAGLLDVSLGNIGGRFIVCV